MDMKFDLCGTIMINQGSESKINVANVANLARFVSSTF